MKAISWNVGSYYFLNYAAKREKSFHGHTIRDVYFQPELNGGFVSAQLEAYDADIVFLQEMHSLDDTEHIPALVNYPHRALLPNAHHEHSMLVAAKRTFETRAQGDFTLVESSGIAPPARSNRSCAPKIERVPTPVRSIR